MSFKAKYAYSTYNGIPRIWGKIIGYGGDAVHAPRDSDAQDKSFDELDIDGETESTNKREEKSVFL